MKKTIPKSINFDADSYKTIRNIGDFMAPAENLIRAIKIDGIMPKSNHDKALDFGSGEGRHAEYLLKLGYSVLATDVSRVAVRVAKSRIKSYKNVDIKLMGIGAKISAADRIFDLIVSWETMHWLGSEKLFLFYLAEFKRILKKHGCIIMTMPTETHYLKNYSIEIDKSQYLCETPERDKAIFYAPNLYTLKKIFHSDFGFNIKRIMRYDHGRADDTKNKGMGLNNLFSMYVFTMNF